MKQQHNEIKRMQQLAGIINENLFNKSGQELDGQETYSISFNGKDYEFAYQEYDNAYICLEPWGQDVASLNKYLQSKGVKTIVDVAPEKTIIIKKDEFEKFINKNGISEKTSLNPIKSIDEVEAILKEKIQELVQDYIDETIETAGEDLDFGKGVIGYDNKKQLIQDFFDYAKGYFDLK